MAININNEALVSLTEATKLVPKTGAKRLAISTLWRWCRKGLRGVRLEYVRIGRGIATSQEALNRFFQALAEADRAGPEHEPGATDARNSAPVAPRPLPTAHRDRALCDADRILDRAGI